MNPRSALQRPRPSTAIGEDDAAAVVGIETERGPLFGPTTELVSKRIARVSSVFVLSPGSSSLRSSGFSNSSQARPAGLTTGLRARPGCSLDMGPTSRCNDRC